MHEQRIDVYQDEQGCFSLRPARNLQEARRIYEAEFIGTVYCDTGQVRDPFGDTLIHVLNDGRQRSFDVIELFERSSKPPKGLRIGIGADNPPPPNYRDVWVARILTARYSNVGPYMVWEPEWSGSERECELRIRQRLRLSADEPLPSCVAILPPLLEEGAAA